jgi:hypothetical protein
VLTQPVWDRDHAGSPTGFGYYRERLASPPSSASLVETRSGDDWQAAIEAERVFVVIRARFPEWITDALDQRFDGHDVTPFGDGLSVHLYHSPHSRLDEPR